MPQEGRIAGLSIANTNGMAVSMNGAEGLLERGVVVRQGWQGLRRERARLGAELLELRTRFRDGHPRIQQVLQMIREIEREKARIELQKYQEHLEELVKERTAELEEKNKKLEEFNELFVNREFRIKELKDKVKELEKKNDG